MQEPSFASETAEAWFLGWIGSWIPNFSRRITNSSDGLISTSGIRLTLLINMTKQILLLTAVEPKYNSVAVCIKRDV